MSKWKSAFPFIADSREKEHILRTNIDTLESIRDKVHYQFDRPLFIYQHVPVTCRRRHARRIPVPVLLTTHTHPRMHQTVHTHTGDSIGLRRSGFLATASLPTASLSSNPRCPTHTAVIKDPTPSAVPPVRLETS